MRKFLILIHRYLGIVLGVLFISWFISGIAMIYARGMPSLTPATRLQRLPPLNAESIHISSIDAIRAAGLDRPPTRVTLTTLAGRPVFRIATKTVFADTGEVMNAVDADRAVEIAAAFMNVSRDHLHASLQNEADQWTIPQRRQMPLHKVTVDDALHTVLYIAPPSGDVVVMTTRASRSLAWIAAIPHWLYFTSLRTKDALWRQTILWTAGAGSLLALFGIILAFMQSKVRYKGWMRWHYWSGAIFGLFTLTWIFSGLLSMDPWNWSLGGGLGNEIRAALSGGPLNAAKFPELDTAALIAVADAPVKEIELARIQDRPYYAVRTSEKKLLIAAETMQIKAEPFSVESLLDRAKKAYPNATIVESQVLTKYDSYYYSRDGDLPLPVFRIKFGDKDRTWMYIDPQASQLARSITRLGRINRWIYHGFHSLDFAFWYDSRPAWDIAVIVLSLGGAVTSILGLSLGLRRLFPL